MSIKFDPPFFRFRAAICRFAIAHVFTVFTNFTPLTICSFTLAVCFKATF